MANIGAGTSVSASGFNKLFERLDAIRANHLNKNGQNATANSSLATPFAKTVAVVGEKPVPNNVEQIKNNLTKLADSAWLDTTFASKITIPTTGTLLKATDFNVFDNTITAVEAVCPNYSQYSNYSNYSNYGNYKNYGNYSNYGNYKNYGNYGQYSNYSHYGRYANYVQYGQYAKSAGCFLEGTLIVLSDGTYKPIEEIVSGEELLAYDEKTNSLQKAFNLKTKQFTSNRIITISLEDGNSIKVTENHPILTTEGWACLDIDTAEQEHNVKPILLKDHMSIITLNNISKIKEIKITNGVFTVYNLEVPYYHTYFANNIVAHNANSGARIK